MRVHLHARRLARLRLVVPCAAGLLVSLADPVRAYDEGAFHEIETKYIFGFTEGSGIGLEGEWEFSPETFAGFGKRQGRYAVPETKLEVEHTPSQYVQIEFGPVLSSYNIRNVPDLDDRHEVTPSGFSASFIISSWSADPPRRSRSRCRSSRNGTPATRRAAPA
jgi:hypothetical protein